MNVNIKPLHHVLIIQLNKYNKITKTSTTYILPKFIVFFINCPNLG